jgi:hypothetical protein
MWGSFDDLKGTCEYILNAFDMPLLKRGKNDRLIKIRGKIKPEQMQQNNENLEENS